MLWLHALRLATVICRSNFEKAGSLIQTTGTKDAKAGTDNKIYTGTIIARLSEMAIKEI